MAVVAAATSFFLACVLVAVVAAAVAGGMVLDGSIFDDGVAGVLSAAVEFVFEVVLGGEATDAPAISLDDSFAVGCWASC